MSPTDQDPQAHAHHLDLRARAGRAVRDLGHALIGHQTDTFQRGDDWEVPDEQMELQGFDDRPVSGRSSPLGLDLHIRREQRDGGDEIVARVTLRSAHEGAPGRSHGGVVAALFDDVYGFVLSTIKQPAFTGELGIRYVGPTPLHVPLTCRVRLASREGRKLFMTGELTVDDPSGNGPGTVCVRSTATFIAIDTTKIPGWGDGV